MTKDDRSAKAKGEDICGTYGCRIDHTICPFCDEDIDVCECQDEQ